MIAFALGAFAALGMYFIVTATLFEKHTIGFPKEIFSTAFHLLRRKLPEIMLAIAAGAVTYLALGGIASAILIASLAITIPRLLRRSQNEKTKDRERESWPALLEEIRVLTGAGGLSLPNAFYKVGTRAPQTLANAFIHSQSEWKLSTDFDLALDTFKQHAQDATADSVAEVFRISYRIGGSDLESRLDALIEDRILDLQARKDAVAKQSGAKFARLFVLIVPAGMAFAGLAIGEGRAAYATPIGQLLTLAAFVCIASCWWWASTLLRLPEEPRVFAK